MRRTPGANRPDKGELAKRERLTGQLRAVAPWHADQSGLYRVRSQRALTTERSWITRVRDRASLHSFTGGDGYQF